MNFISYILFASRDRLMSFVGCNWAINFFHEAKTTVFYLNQQFLNAGMGVVLKISVFFTIFFIYLKRQRVVHISGISKSINKETTIP